jgi:hypothetical protein
MCGFLKKYQVVNDMACKGFVRVYCQGDKMKDCERKKYRQEHGKLPDDDMMPNGKNVFKTAK